MAGSARSGAVTCAAFEQPRGKPVPTVSMSRTDDQPQRPVLAQVQEVRFGRTALLPDSELFQLDPASEQQDGAVKVQRVDGILLDTGPCHEMPYTRTRVHLGPGSAAEALWSGIVPEGRRVSLWAQPPGDTAAWWQIARAEGRGP